MTFELQHADIPQGKLLDADPVTEHWPLPPVRRWEPKSDIDRMCEEANEKLAVKLGEWVSFHKNEITLGFDMLHHRLGVVPQSLAVEWNNPCLWLDRSYIA